MIGFRARLGFLLPPGNPTIEPEMMAMAPAGVSLHFHRMVARGAPGSLNGQAERAMATRWFTDLLGWAPFTGASASAARASPGARLAAGGTPYWHRI